jgi:Putative beta-barrel porin-2, OmpL-like. bbp2
MKISKTALLAAIACAFGGQGWAAEPTTTANSYGYYAADSAPVASQAGKNVRLASAEIAEVIPASCSCSDTPISGCDTGCGDGACDSIGGCDSACGCGGDPWRLFSNDPLGLTIGGWSNIGYHTQNTNRSFNNYADHVQLQQQWLYAEKIADGSCGLGFGGRIDYVYGTDAPDTQAFGINNNHWDNSWDNGGAYGHAIPQLYGEVAYGDLSVKAGHFFTIIGNEVVAATGNFFYSRQLTFYNSEPFTHTGALTSYKVDDSTTVWNGYVAGWDSGFEDNGDAYIGGFSRALGDNTTFIYTNTLGRFNENFGAVAGNAERGQLHSAILSVGLTDNLKYINQNDYLHTNNAAGLGHQ